MQEARSVPRRRCFCRRRSQDDDDDDEFLYVYIYFLWTVARQTLRKGFQVFPRFVHTQEHFYRFSNWSGAFQSPLYDRQGFWDSGSCRERGLGEISKFWHEFRLRLVAWKHRSLSEVLQTQPVRNLRGSHWFRDKRAFRWSWKRF